MANSNLKRNLSIECKPKLLKDFLNDDSTPNDFVSYPLKPCKQVVQNQHLIVFKISKSRATTSTILAIHKASEIVIKTLKYFSFASIKSQTILPKSITRNKEKDDNQRRIISEKVKVKDILRWRSSRDLVAEESTPLDIFYSGSTSCSRPLTSKSSSWCGSDFSAEDFPSWCYASEVCYGENEKRIMDETEEQYTPVSVLASPFQEEREFNYNSYDSLMQDNLLMDFFWEELTISQKDENDELLESKLIAIAEDWVRGENKRATYFEEMEKGLKWNKHEQEKEEIVLELKKLVLNSLVDEVLFDIITL